MSHSLRKATLAASLIIVLCYAGMAQNATTQNKKGAAVTAHATGTFEVKMEPQSEDKGEGATLGRTSLSKQFHGSLEGTSKGEMLSAMSAVKGSAGYVAIERFTGTLDGRSGTFALQHSGSMNRGVPQLSITVVPDSGTGQLTGLAGRMTIDVTGGKHSYVFDYTVDVQPR